MAEEVVEADRRLAAYLRATQPRLLPHLDLVERGTGGRRLVLDAKTLRHLEINRPMNPDDAKGVTLLGTWDETVTAPGRRTLAFWLTNPLADAPSITLRQDAVQSLVDRGAALEGWRTHLHSIPDLSRIAARVAGRRVRTGRARGPAGGPRGRRIPRPEPGRGGILGPTHEARRGARAPDRACPAPLRRAAGKPLAHRGLGRVVPARATHPRWIGGESLSGRRSPR